MHPPDTLINQDKTVTAVIMAFAKGNRYGIGNERMLIVRRATPDFDSRQLELCETTVSHDESPLQAGLRCANQHLWLFDQGEEALLPQDVKFIGLVEWPDRQQFIFQINFLVPCRFVRDISRTDYLPLDKLITDWERFTPSSLSALNGLPQIYTLHETTQRFFGGAQIHA